MPPQKLKKLKPLKTKVKAHNTSILMSPVPVGSPDEQQAPDASAAPAVAKKKGKKITLRELPHEGAGLAANRPPPRADLDSIYVPAKPGRRESLGGMTGNLSPLARLSRVCSGPVASRFHEVSTVDLCLEVEFDTLVQALSRRLSDWLAILSDDAVKDLADIAEVKYVRAGEALFSQGQTEHSQALWVLLDGMVLGSLKPGLHEVPVLVASDLREEESTLSSISSKKKQGKNKKSVSKRGKQQSAGQVKSDGAEEAIKAIKEKNDAIVPVPLFATRTFGAVFGEDTLLSGDKHGYSLVAELDSKLCCISKEDYMMLFLTDDQAVERVRSYRKGAMTRAFASASGVGSLVEELFPEDLQAALQDQAILRRFHAGQRIMAPDKRLRAQSKDAASALNDNSNDAQEHADARGGQQDDQPPAEQLSEPLLEQRPEPLLEEPSMFFLVSGQLDVIRFDEHDDRHLVCTSDVEGAIFGEFGVLMGDSYMRSVGVFAMTDGQLCELPKDLLAHMMAEVSLRKDFRFKLKSKIADEECKDVIRVAGMYASTSMLLQRMDAKKSLMRPKLSKLDSDTEDEDLTDANNVPLLNKLPGIEIVRNAGSDDVDIARALTALDDAEKALFNAESQLKRAQEGDDWAMFYKDVIDDIEIAAANYSEVLVKHSKMLPLQGFDRLSLDRKMARLDLMMLQVSTFMPPGKMQTERMTRCKAVQQLLLPQKDFARLMHVRHFRIDWQSGTAVCNFVEQCSERIKVLEDGVSRHRDVLIQRYGERAGACLFDQLHKWYQRKSAAWQRCSELVQQHNLFVASISNLEWQSRHRPLLEYESYKLREMRVKSDETLRVAEKIRLDLLPLNRAVVHTCFSGMPPPPAPAVTSSPILSFLQYLQKIIELREDLRLAKATATHQADTMMNRTFKECSIGEVTEPPRKFSSEEAIPRRPDGSRDVAPVLQSFLTDLGSWLFAKDVDRWAKQARKAQRIGASSCSGR